MIARALGQRSVAAELAWALAALAGALGVVFLVHSSFCARAVDPARAWGWRRSSFASPAPSSTAPRGFALVALSGVVLGALLWHIAPRALTGDSPFHLARVRKLVELGSLSPGRLDELVGGGLHPGYAFPLWHAFLAAVDEARRRRSGARRAARERAARAARGGRRVRGRDGALRLADARRRHRRGAGGDRRVRRGPRRRVPAARPAGAGGEAAARPGRRWRSSSRTRAGRRGAIAALRRGRVARARARPPDVRGVPLHPARRLAARGARSPRDAVPGASPRGSPPSPFRRPPSGSRCCRSRATPCRTRRRRWSCCARSRITTTSSSCTARATTSRRRSSRETAPSRSPRSILVPLAALAWGRRWSSFVLGGSLAVLAVMLVPFLFEHLSDAVSLSQSRRAAGFLPFAFALVGGVAVLSGLLGIFVLPIALARRSRLPGRCGPETSASGSCNGGPQHAAWFAVGGRGGCARRRGLFVRRPLELDRDGWLPRDRGRPLRPAGRRPRLRALDRRARGRRRRAHARSRRRACARRCRNAVSSSRTSRRATASRPPLRCSSRPRRPNTSRTRSRTGRTSAATT